MAGVFRPEAIPDAERLRPERVVEGIRDRGVKAVHLPEVDEIIEYVKRENRGNAVALIMSNGAFGGIHERLLARLRRGNG